MWSSWVGPSSILASSHHHCSHVLSNEEDRLHKPGLEQGPAQDCSLLPRWAAVGSFHSPLVLWTLCSWKPSWEQARAHPPSVRAEPLQMKNGDLNPPSSVLRPLKQQASTLTFAIASFNNASRKMNPEFWRLFCLERLDTNSKHMVHHVSISVYKQNLSYTS